MSEKALKRLLSYVFYSPDGCWYWIGPVGIRGYGRFSFEGKNRIAHRVSYILHKGDPGKLLVCHSCDNTLCVNPGHLFLGTNKDNMVDMVKKGRSGSYKGMHNGVPKLSTDQVLLIRSTSAKISELSLKFGVSESTISRLKTRKSWKHI